jgi:hypothetical protein
MMQYGKLVCLSPWSHLNKKGYQKVLSIGVTNILNLSIESKTRLDVTRFNLPFNFTAVLSFKV